MFFRVFILLVALCGQLVGQEPKLKVTSVAGFAVIGLTNPQTVEGSTFSTTKPTQVKPAGLLDVVTEASDVKVVAFGTGLKPVELTKLADRQWSWTAPGTTVFIVTATDWDKRINETSIVTAELESAPPGPGPGPGPDPVPNPTVPDDRFENIGKRVASWATGLPKRKEVAAVYRNAAKRLRTDLAATVNIVTSEIESQRTVILTGSADSYAKLIANLNDDVKKRWPLTKRDLSDYCEAIAAGLESDQ